VMETCEFSWLAGLDTQEARFPWTQRRSPYTRGWPISCSLGGRKRC